jgi:toxin ParE1/3/4
MGTRLMVAWHPEAVVDLKQAVTDIRELAGDDAAFDFYDKVRIQVGRLGDFPHLGKRGRVEGTRELVIAGYKRIAVYQINDALARIEVLVLLHARRKWPPE